MGGSERTADRKILDLGECRQVKAFDKTRTGNSRAWMSNTTELRDSERLRCCRNKEFCGMV